MKDFRYKLRLIYVPFLLMAVGYLLLYSFLHWLLFIRTNTFSINDEWVELWIPWILSIMPVFIWLRPRIKLLHFKKDNGSFGYQFLASLAIAAPTMIAQPYLSTATGKLTSLQTMSELTKAPPTRYYAVKDCYVDKVNIGVETTASVSGKGNSTLNYHLYIVMPVVDKPADTATGRAAYWLGKKYVKSISNRLSDEEKEKSFQAFSAAVQAEFDTTDFRQFTYLEKAGNTDDHRGFNRAMKRSALFDKESSLVFTASTKPFSARSGHMLEWIFIALGIGCVIFGGMLLAVPFRAGALKEHAEGIKQESSTIKDGLHLFIPRKDYFITPLIMDINILLFVLMVFAGLGFITFDAQDLLKWGADYRPLTMNGEYWRLLTSVFLHGGLIHLVANMVGLLFAGLFLEPVLGKVKYALVYLATGIAASCASLWWHDATVSVGASGAIFGLYGFLLALLLLKVLPPEFSKAFMSTTLVFIGYNLLMGLLGSGVDNAAHIGGLVSGFLLGVLMARSLRKEGTNLSTPFDTGNANE